MASSGSKMDKIGVMLPVFVPAALATIGYTAWKIDWTGVLNSLFIAEGRIQRLSLLAMVLLNLKVMPLAWTTRVFGALIRHGILRPAPQLGPRALFAPVVTTTRAPLLEIDYNFHKSNSTYFADLDVARSHFVAYICRPGIKALSNNTATRLVTDPRTGKPAAGAFGIILGAVQCSFRAEISAYKGYEMWTRLLSWDRKWLYMATHFVPVGTAKPTEWLDPRVGLRGTRMPNDKVLTSEDWEKKVYASSVSKYVFKLGRLTVHPAILLEASGLLPQRPGGWVGGERDVGDESEVIELGKGHAEWDWRKAESMRREGMKFAAPFLALDGLQQTFDGGNDGAVASF